MGIMSDPSARSSLYINDNATSNVSPAIAKRSVRRVAEHQKTAQLFGKVANQRSVWCGAGRLGMGNRNGLPRA